MTLMTCAAVQRRLQAFHDRELPVDETISIQQHVVECPPCARDLRAMRSVGDALRLAAAPAPADDWAGVQAGVISRMRAEAHESFGARARRFLDDLHLVWIGLASASATVVCAGTVLSVLQFAPAPGRVDSLAAIISVLSAPGGSDLNPTALDGRNLYGGPMVIQAPKVPHDSVVYATLETALIDEEDMVVPMSANVTREGRLSELRALEVTDEDVRALIHKLSNGRMEPMRYGGNPVAVNYVWLLAHTTVKPGKT